VNTQRVRELISVITESEKYGGEGPRGPPTSLGIMPGDTPKRGGRQRNPGVFVRWLGSQVLYSRAGAPLHQGFETKLRSDNRVFPADLSLTYR